MLPCSGLLPGVAALGGALFRPVGGAIVQVILALGQIVLQNAVGQLHRAGGVAHLEQGIRGGLVAVAAEGAVVELSVAGPDQGAVVAAVADDAAVGGKAAAVGIDAVQAAAVDVAAHDLHPVAAEQLHHAGGAGHVGLQVMAHHQAVEQEVVAVIEGDDGLRAGGGHQPGGAGAHDGHVLGAHKHQAVHVVVAVAQPELQVLQPAGVGQFHQFLAAGDLHHLALDALGQVTLGQRAGGDDGFALRNLIHPLVNHLNQRVGQNLLGDVVGKALPVHRQRTAGGDVGVSRRLHGQRAEDAHLLFKHPGRRADAGRLERIGADQLRKALIVVGGGVLLRLHLVERNRHARIGQCPGHSERPFPCHNPYR